MFPFDDVIMDDPVHLRQYASPGFEGLISEHMLLTFRLYVCEIYYQYILVNMSTFTGIVTDYSGDNIQMYHIIY